jgi:transposase
MKPIPESQQSRPKASSKTGRELQVLNPDAAGIDIGSTHHFVCVPRHAVPEAESNVRRFGSFTHELDQVVEWLKACAVTTVVMESTGVYWIALFQKVEQAGIQVMLVNARDVKHLPGRKTDLKDCQWLQQLHSYGLLRGAFRPSDGICRMRSLMRHRGHLVGASAEQVQLMQKALQQMNVLLHHVVSDIDGETGLRILDAIVAGERDPERLVALRSDRIKRSTPEQMEAALRGDWRAEHLFVLRQSLEAYRFFQRQIQDCDLELQQVLEELAAGLPEPMAESEVNEEDSTPKKQKKRKNLKIGNAPQVDLRPSLNRIVGVDLTGTTGINLLSALILVSEIGTDMSRWRDEKAFASWLGLSPDHKISGGRILNNRTRPVANRAATVLRLVSLALGKTETVFGHFYRRIRARAGAPKAITALARKVACLIYQLLKHKKPYVEPDLALYLERFERQRVQNLQRQAKTLGFKLVPAT